MDLITDNSVLVPGICGPLGLLPIRPRLRASCEARGMDTPNLMSGAPTSVNLNQPSGYRLTQ